MALAPLGTLDLSVVTDRLLAIIRGGITTWPLWDVNGGPIARFDITSTGSMPETVRVAGGCHLNLYLLHVREDPYQRNAPVTGRSLPVPLQPMSLQLTYLLTAFSGEDYRQEQRAMSIALRALYENPIVRMTVVIAGVNVDEEFTVQMQAESPDELGRVWQAISAPFRLATVYRASVVFVTPEAPATASAPPPERVVLAAAPASLPFLAGGQVTGTSSVVTYKAPDSTVADPRELTYHLSPATVARGGRFRLLGGNLGGSTSARVFLLPASGGEQEVTAWVDSAESTPSSITLEVPAAGAVPPAGVHRLSVGSDAALGDPETFRSNTTPFSISARVGPAANPPLLAPVAGTYTLSGGGFVAAATDVLVGTVSLSRVTVAPGPGEFRVVSPATITFQLPAGMPSGTRHDVRVRVNDVESAPAWWVVVP
ncbi:MAG TPA: DUF4255 domain-containing protein [Acidimicrobiales bacterium]|nr:DUF4255 domain-containing protein [Acidimicrobiales bacterium]